MTGLYSRTLLCAILCAILFGGWQHSWLAGFWFFSLPPLVSRVVLATLYYQKEEKQT